MKAGFGIRKEDGTGDSGLADRDSRLLALFFCFLRESRFPSPESRLFCESRFPSPEPRLPELGHSRSSCLPPLVRAPPPRGGDPGRMPGNPHRDTLNSIPPATRESPAPRSISPCVTG